MYNSRFDWRWLVLIVVVAVMANSSRLPWPLLVVALGGGGGYLLLMGWQVWNGGTSSGPQVKYWRGQRYEVRPQRRSGGLPPFAAIRPALLYLVFGATLVLAALAVVLRRLG